MTPQPTIQSNAEILKRYQDGYRVAKFVNTIGQLCKGLGILLAIIIVMAGAMASENMRNQFGYQMSNDMALLPFVVVALLVGAAFWIFGMLIATNGQLLKASFDTAVNSSPFLSNEDKLRAIL